MSKDFRPFQGELMICCMCGQQLKSDPLVESGWSCIQVDDKPYYICPGELPTGPASVSEYKNAYKRIMSKILRSN